MYTEGDAAADAGAAGDCREHGRGSKYLAKGVGKRRRRPGPGVRLCLPGLSLLKAARYHHRIECCWRKNHSRTGKQKQVRVDPIRGPARHGDKMSLLVKYTGVWKASRKQAAPRAIYQTTTRWVHKAPTRGCKQYDSLLGTRRLSITVYNARFSARGRVRIPTATTAAERSEWKKCSRGTEAISGEDLLQGATAQ